METDIFHNILKRKFERNQNFLILSGFLLIILSFSVLYCNDISLDLNYQNPCFEKDIVPLVKRDCSRCHENGEYRFKVIGSRDDYQILYSYADTQNPDESLILKYATGKKKHPKIWNEGSKEYLTMYNWIANGGKEGCIDTNFGECQSDEECEEISCICEDLSVVTASRCYIDGSGIGRCASDNNCAEPVFGLCKSNEMDAGNITDSNGVNDIVVADNGTDTSYVDSGSDSGSFDSGYDVGIDYGYDTGYDAGYDSGVKDTGFDAGYDVGSDTGNTSTVSFSAQIVPLVKTDCRSCHYAGQHGVKLTGTVSDYSEVMRYVDVNNPEAPYGFLWWASGGNGHPNKWPKGGTKYNLFLKWVNEGAKNN
ncbi:MAG: hypothetical protein ACP5KG_02795 [Myxococcota bacterium]